MDFTPRSCIAFPEGWAEALGQAWDKHCSEVWKESRQELFSSSSCQNQLGGASWIAAALQGQETAQSDLMSPGRDSRAGSSCSQSQTLSCPTRTSPNHSSAPGLCCSPIPKSQWNTGTAGFSQGSTDVPQKQKGEAGAEPAGAALCFPPAPGLRDPYPHSYHPRAECLGHPAPQNHHLCFHPTPAARGFSCWSKATAPEPPRPIFRKVFARFDCLAQCWVHSPWPTHTTEHSRDPFGLSTAPEGTRSLLLPQEPGFPACWHSFAGRLLPHPRHGSRTSP